MTINISLPKLPFKLPSNATLYFKSYDGTITVDEVTGNREPNFEIVEIKASLTETGDKLKEDNLPGTNVYSRSLIGYVLTKTLPIGLDSSDRVECDLNFNNKTEKGFLYFAERVTPFNKEIHSKIGIPIQGTFQTLSGGS